METKHTPTPWQARLHEGGPLWIIGPDPDNFNIIATTTKGNDKANAKFIVRACNSHVKLLAACKELHHFLTESVGQVLTHKMASDAYVNSLTKDRVEAAIAEAEKE